MWSPRTNLKKSGFFVELAFTSGGEFRKNQISRYVRISDVSNSVRNSRKLVRMKLGFEGTGKSCPGRSIGGSGSSTRRDD
jgi:hypothetical protein